MSDDAGEFIYRFETPIPARILGGNLALHGWLVQRDDKPIHGIRTLLKRPLRKRETLRGRRKRKRPEIAAAFPHLSTAEDSGFLLELQLGFGKNELTFQVRDHEMQWRTFATAEVFAVPLELLRSVGLTSVRQFTIDHLSHAFAQRETNSLNENRRFAKTATPTAPLRTKRVDLFATRKSNLFILEIGELVAAGFRELGLEASLRIDEIPEEKPPDDLVQIVVTPHEYYNLFLSERFARERCEEVTRGVYLLCTEQPETGWFYSNLPWAMQARGVADINPLGVAAYRARTLSAYHLQLGFHPLLAAPGVKPHSERANEIVFLGSLTQRRERFMAKHGDFFAQHRCHLRFVPLGFAKTETTRSYLSAVKRNQLLNDSRILLNLHYSEQRYFEWHRMLIALANGCCVITETCDCNGPLVPGEHFVMVEREHLIAACDYYLGHPDECQAIAEAGRTFVETNLRQASGCRRLLEEFEMSQPASPSFNAEGLALPRALRRQLSRHTRQLFVHALKKDFGRNGSEQEGFDKDERASRPPVDEDLRCEVVTRREGYRARRIAQDDARKAGRSVITFHDNNAYAEATNPRLSIVVTLYNYAQHIDECLVSAQKASAQIREPTEIVIVNDASTDDSLARALQNQGKASTAMRVVDKHFNTGLADARNTGVQVARAPYVFMLDADNLVYPGALKQLLVAISAGEYAAAYSLLCRFRGTPANRVGLLSHYDWDPQILVQHPYIDAMAMFSRDALLALGGYDSELSQIGWFGWEDYDMWLRLAQRGMRVAFVPNTLCLYRHHETSMINSTNLFEMDLVRHFGDRFGDLLNRFEPRETAFGVARGKMQ